jgi:hypothetical protein
MVLPVALAAVAGYVIFKFVLPRLYSNSSIRSF